MRFIPFLSLMLFAISSALLSGCAGSDYVYSPHDQMLTASSHNNFLELGPCGSPWNYNDQINILFNGDGPRFESGQLEVYQEGKLKIDSGYVMLDLTNKTVMIHLTFEGYDDAPVPCKYNGTHKLTVRDPVNDELTRGWLQNFFKTNETDFYQP